MVLILVSMERGDSQLYISSKNTGIKFIIEDPEGVATTPLSEDVLQKLPAGGRGLFYQFELLKCLLHIPYTITTLYWNRMNPEILLMIWSRAA